MYYTTMYYTSNKCFILYNSATIDFITVSYKQEYAVLYM